MHHPPLRCSQIRITLLASSVTCLACLGLLIGLLALGQDYLLGIRSLLGLLAESQDYVSIGLLMYCTRITGQVLGLLCFGIFICDHLFFLRFGAMWPRIQYEWNNMSQDQCLGPARIGLLALEQDYFMIQLSSHSKTYTAEARPPWIPQHPGFWPCLCGCSVTWIQQKTHAPLLIENHSFFESKATRSARPFCGAACLHLALNSGICCHIAH